MKSAWGVVVRGVVVACAIGGAPAAELVVKRATDLRSERYTDAPVIGALAEGVRVEWLAAEAGWVQVRTGGRSGWMRATALTGDGATVSSLSRVEAGRSASGNIVVAAGIRRLPKASSHALIIGVDGVGERRWPGVAWDVEAARAIAERIGVPTDDVDVIDGARATADGIAGALDRLVERVRGGDRVYVHFSGPGTQVADGGACVAAWAGADGRALVAATLAAHLRPLAAVADKLLVVSDAAYGASPASGTTRTIASAAKDCTGATTLPLVAALSAAGVEAQNMAMLQAGPGPGQGLDHPRAGGSFTQAVLDCVLGDAVDLDRSASISIAEVATCANRAARGPGAVVAAVSGNGAYSPIVGLDPRAARGPVDAAAATPPRAVIDDIVAQRDGRIAVTLKAVPSTLAIGRDFLDLTLASTRPGFVYLVLLGSDGNSFYLLFPNDLDHDNRIAAGESLRLPRPGWRVQAQGPAGTDTLLAIVAESERDLSMLGGAREGPFSVALTDGQGRARLQDLLGRSGRAGSSDCVDAGRRRNLGVVAVCSDAYGAAVLEVIER